MKNLFCIAATTLVMGSSAMAQDFLLTADDVSGTLYTSCILADVGQSALIQVELLARSYSDYEKGERTDAGRVFSHPLGGRMVLQGSEQMISCNFTMPVSAVLEDERGDILETLNRRFLSLYGVPSQVEKTDTGEVWSHTSDGGNAMSVTVGINDGILSVVSLTQTD